MNKGQYPSFFRVCYASESCVLKKVNELVEKLRFDISCHYLFYNFRFCLAEYLAKVGYSITVCFLGGLLYSLYLV